MLLGKFLLQLRLVTPVQLDAALRAQVAHGGRLGTNLLRLGYIEPDSLTAALAKQLDVRGVSIQRLSRLDELTLRRIPGAVAHRNRALPLGLVEDGGRRSLCVAFADPRDLGCLDEVAFACGLPVIPFVAPELCIQTYLAQYYGRQEAVQAQNAAHADQRMATQQSEQRQGTAPMATQAAVAGGGARVVPLRPVAAQVTQQAPQAAPAPIPQSQQRPERTPSPAQFWATPGASPRTTGRISNVPQGYHPAAGSDARSMEQALRVASEYRPQPPHPGQGYPRERYAEEDPIRFGAPNPVEEAKRAPFPIKSDLELDAPRNYREDDFNLPTPQPRYRELDENGRLAEESYQQQQQPPHHPHQAQHPAPLRGRQRSEEVDLAGLDTSPASRRRDAPTADQSDAVPTEAASTSADQPLAGTQHVRKRPALSLNEALSALKQASSREVVGDIVVDYLRSAFGCGLIFICKDDLCLGWKGFAPGTPESTIESIVVPLGTPSMFKIAFQRESMFRGGPPKDGETVQQRLWKLFQTKVPEEVVIAPVLLGKRVVNLVYAHAFDGGPLSDAAVMEVNLLANAMRDIFTSLIKSKSQKK